MRFVCETCQTRYIIPDERARGRVLKVRCKKCGNVIILKAEAEEVAAAAPAPAQAKRGRSTVSEEATQMVDSEALRQLRAESARPPSNPGSESELGNPPEEVAQWHVILSGKQQGPLAINALIEKMLGGQMTARSYVWREGMGDWKRAEEIPDVARWLPAQPSPTPGPRRIPQAPGRADGPSSEGAPEAPRKEPKPARSKAKKRVDDAVDAFFEGAEANDEPVFIPESKSDPFAQVQDAAGLNHPKPGEVTKFFITQAGVQKTRSPWRYLVWGLGTLVLLAGVIILLSRLGVSVPLMPENPDRSQRIFSGGGGDSRIKDLLYGRPREPAAPKPGANAGSRPATGPSLPEQGPLAKKAEQHVDQLGKSDKDQLAQLYASQHLSVNLKPSSVNAPVVDRTDAPLTPEQVSRTVARFQGSYAGCIERELKRNPNFPGGKIRVVTTIGSSGLVKQAQIQSDDAKLQRAVAGGPLGACLVDQTRRMVFPSFSGEPFDAEIPLVLNSSM